MHNQAELSLRSSRLSSGEMERILLAAPRGIAVVDGNGRFRFVSERFADTFGYDSENELVGFLANGVIRTQRGASCLVLGTRETILVRRNGSEFPARINVQELDQQDRTAGLFLDIEDLTESRQIESVLRNSERLASAGRMAAAIAHEINNPLEAVMNLLYLLRNESHAPSADHLLSLAESELERVSRIARQTLAFYRESGKPTRVDLREVLNLAADVHCTRLPEVRVHRRYRTSQFISGYLSELQQVFHNLIGNAIDAGAHDIFLHLRNVTEIEAPHRKGVLISVADNGSGIDESVRAHIFNPFITTKGEKGTGLGLWTSRGIVVRHGGTIKLRTSTAPGHTGTCFSIFLPQ